MRYLRILPLLLVIVVVGAAAGCGGDDDDEEAAAPAETATETEAPAGAQTVGMTEFEFEPNDLTASQGDAITAENTGSTVHNLTIEEGPDPEKASPELAATPDVDAGQSGELTVDVDPGEYSIVCTIANHRELGMIGTIKVE
ncbi:MAG TPA: plastocyanin/azurin family copper-binding protein [Solirubrobacterales bacterium]|jgi:plastocyanin|nr:plastocyanin/azurin family copper-binding protein [Solirubrobacterales bacterium]